MTTVNLPLITITRGLPFETQYTVRDNSGNVDFTGYTAAFTLAESLEVDALATGTCTADAFGQIVISLTKDQTTALSARPELGAHRMGVFQIQLTGDGTDDFLMHGDFHLIGRID